MQLARAKRPRGLLAWLHISLLLTLMGASLALAPRVSEHWGIELVRYLPFPVWMAGALLTLLLSLWRNWVWRLASAAALLLVLIVIMGLTLRLGDNGAGRLRVMTYNIKSYLAIDRSDAFARIAWEVVQEDPDILVLQDAGLADVQRPTANDSVRAMLRDRKIYSYGQYVVASRLPLKDCQPGDIAYRGQPHSYVRCTVVARGREIDLITAHLLSPRDGLNATRHERLAGIAEWRQNFADRLSQANKLVTDLALYRSVDAVKAPGKPRPLILAGDLNAPEASPVVQTLLDAGLRDAHSAAGQGNGYTHGHSLRPGLSFLRIDHILVSPDLGVADCHVGGEQGSEHRPVIADLWLDRN
jgi:endonuclease/exonuclease/phosphatase family metal-dependent hydrolase